jgi:hypothetical protein
MEAAIAVSLCKIESLVLLMLFIFPKLRKGVGKKLLLHI